MYKNASKLKLRFLTSKGLLTVEQLWDLSLKDLGLAAQQLNSKIKEQSPNDDLSFLEESNKTDPIDQLRFDILKDIYITRKAALEENVNNLKIKEYNKKILSLIAEKDDESLKSKTKEELEKLLK